MGMKMTMNWEYDSVVGVILPVENKILPIYTPQIEINKNTPIFFTLFAKNTAAVFLLVVKMAAPLLKLTQKKETHTNLSRSFHFEVECWKDYFGGPFACD